LNAAHLTNKFSDEFQAIIATSLDGFLLVDFAGNIIETNSNFCQMTGYTRDDILSMDITSLDGVDNHDDVAGRIEKIVQLDSIRFDSKLRHKNGSIIEVEVCANHSPTYGGSIFSFIRDVTSQNSTRRIVAARLRLLEYSRNHSMSELLRQTLDEAEVLTDSSIGFYHFMDDDKQELTLQAWSTNTESKSCKVEGIASHYNISQAGVWVDCVRERRPVIHNDYASLPLRKGMPDGHAPVFRELVVPVFRHNKIVAILGVGNKQTDYNEQDIEVISLLADLAWDIAEGKLAEEKQILNARFLQTVTDSLPGTVGYWDDELRCCFANQIYFKWFGKTKEEMLGITLQELLGEKLFRKNEPYIRNVLQGKSQQFENILEDSNGEIRYKWIQYIPDLIDGKVKGFFVLVSDVTELRHAQEEQYKLVAQLQQAQKMEFVGRLAGGVAHDFNNMLTIILGNVQLALMGLDPSHPLHDYLQHISDAAERSADLTRQLLAFARKQTVSPKVVDLNVAVESVLKMLQRLIGEDIKLAWCPGDNLWSIKIDTSQLDQILANLCVNARDAISDIGTITIESGNKVIDENFCISHAGLLPGQYVRLAMSDSGSGMDKETLSHLFEPFYTTKEQGKGTGLGLATVYGAVKQNNGYIYVCSELGKGTTFTIYLPRYKGKNSEPAYDEGTYRLPDKGHETIILVEDEPDILNMITDILTLQGYHVLAANTPGEAMKYAREYDGIIHLLMTDVVMPEMNGRDLAKNMLALYPNIKRLFMSGYTADVIAHHGVLEDGVQFIQKPFNMNTLAEKIREVLDSSEGMGAIPS
jgi:PAS domain S-box-containing protein